tara:strand:+ start:2016 stop:2378 length:363 start_codon:yes stop_codon:yes gene_type:complete
MMAENYLYFAIDGDNDTDKDAIMFPRSRFLGATSTNATTLEFFFEDREGAGPGNDDVSCTITSGGHKAVLKEFVELANGNRNNTNNFTVIRDLNGDLPTNEGPISAAGISAISAMTITTG